MNADTCGDAARPAPPCRCLDSHALALPWHPGHCCLLLPGQTCHRAQVEAWVRQDRAIHGGES